MKKRLLLSLLCFVFMLLSACQREAAVRYYLCSDLFKCCEPKLTASQTEYRFYTYLVTPEPELEVEVVEVKGQNVDQCKVEFQGIDDGTTADDFQYKGYYNRMLSFRVTTDAQEISIESITLKINGEVAEYPYASPIHLTREEECPTEDPSEDFPVYGTKIPLTTTVRDFLNGRITWDFVAEEDVWIESIALDDFFRLKNVTVTIPEGDRVDRLNLEADEPVLVPGGCEFWVEFDAEYADGSQWSHLDYIRTPFTLRYTAADSGKEYEFVRNECGTYPYAESDEDLVKAYIDHALSRMEQEKS